MAYDKEYPVIPFRYDRAGKEALKRIAEERGQNINRLMREIVDAFLKASGKLTITRTIH